MATSTFERKIVISNSKSLEMLELMSEEETTNCLSSSSAFHEEKIKAAKLLEQSKTRFRSNDIA